MQNHCKKCNATLLLDNLSPERKMELWKIRTQEGPLVAIKSLADFDGLSLTEAKRIVLHITPEAGRCNGCGKNDLVGFEVACAACGSLNLNWVAAEN